MFMSLYGHVHFILSGKCLEVECPGCTVSLTFGETAKLFLSGCAITFPPVKENGLGPL